MRYVKISTKVERRIESLKQSGKAGKAVADKADTIIESLKSGAFLDYTEYMGPFTKYGEKRIRNCRKYDFGNGYRLITLQKGKTILIPFLGTHDECHRWLETNNKSKHIAAGKGTIVSVPCESQEAEDTPGDEIPGLCMDETSLDISEQDLRIVFRGLVEGAKRRSK
ncbi:MAG: hypothetical protein PVG39_19620 [Desulfobacteraceae bacterium]|jgi:hypothetical protein